jgi:hypothetical protein
MKTKLGFQSLLVTLVLGAMVALPACAEAQPEEEAGEGSGSALSGVPIARVHVEEPEMRGGRKWAAQLTTDGKLKSLDGRKLYAKFEGNFSKSVQETSDKIMEKIDNSPLRDRDSLVTYIPPGSGAAGYPWTFNLELLRNNQWVVVQQSQNLSSFHEALVSDVQCDNLGCSTSTYPSREGYMAEHLRGLLTNILLKVENTE